MKKFDLPYFLNLLPLMIKYVTVTFKMSILSLGFGLFLAIIIALIVHMKVKVMYPIAKMWVSFFRGTPLIAQLFFLYFGLVQIFPSLKGIDAFTAVVIGLSFNASAYMAETLRAAIGSVDKGQMEACLSVGMSYMQAMRRIILPQAARVAIPPLSNSFIDIIKGSSLAFTLGVTEIMAVAQSEGASSYRFLESFTAVILLYWIIISIFSYIQKILEKKMNESY
ncbi:amino acid ABC transporter permease [Clostridium algidicarnis]|uniref:amino acid ABC transporter permease n=1 Tax=Clostridium algidicarnis TaxID=37659 RepID=UPI000495EAD9|nr:amino acid ABC transporter permease [Clostridium algidicarnis]MBU3227309.1 amino acid ABC transporter permease [Clostridium algidicarnis]MBU3250832.1 amino acid ABC transporter permease [Clostridium algidicarnis]